MTQPNRLPDDRIICALDVPTTAEAARLVEAQFPDLKLVLRTAAEQVLAAELQARGDGSDALSMMVSSIARMVQAGKSSQCRQPALQNAAARWQASCEWM